MLKKVLNLLVIGFFIFCLSGVSSAGVWSKFMAAIQGDLTVTVLYKDHKDLIQGSKVYLAQDLQGEKTIIGEVKGVSRVDPDMSGVALVVGRKYKDRIYETTPFVLVSGLFSGDSESYIVALPALDSSEKKQLESGASVKGYSVLDYKIAAAGKLVKELMQSLKAQNEAFFEKLQAYVESLDTEAFEKEMDEMIDKISKFSEEQKESFKKEVLPSIRQKFDEMIKSLEKNDHPEKSKEMEKKLMEIEDIVDA